MDTNNNKQWPVKPLAILIILIAIFSLSGITLARYVMEKREQGIVEADDFYFTSDLLKAPSANAKYYIDPKDTTFQITLMNFSDAFRITEKDINYTVEVENGTANPTSGMLTGKSAQSAAIMITPDNSGDVTVTVTSTSPYEKSLSAVFHRSLGNQYEVEDISGHRAAVLTMTCIDDGKAIKIILPSGVIPDESDHRVTKADGANTYSFASPGMGVYSLVLLKEDLSVELSGEGAFGDEINIRAK